MIKRLHMINFRRHADTEIVFGEDQKLIVISGLNGAGKSTIVEGITYALFGEPRTGRAGRRRSHVDNLVRRGAEFEGMQVELDFLIGDTEYSVVRRRDNHLSSAVLYGNGNPLIEGPDQVTTEITRILGMNAAGFRLAVVAEQRELDGLASLQPAKRAQMLARLLRLDAVTAARDKCRVMFNRERDIANSLSAADDVAALEAAALEARDELERAQGALEASREAIGELDGKIVDRADIEVRYREAQAALVRAETAVVAAAEELGRAEAELADLLVPEAVDTGDVDVSSLIAESAELERMIAQGESAKELAEGRQVIADELVTASQRLRDTKERLVVTREAHQTRAEVEVELNAHEIRLVEIDVELTSERDTLVRAQAAFETAQMRVSVATGLGAVCDSCQQVIDEEHRHTQLEQAHQAVAEARALLEAAQTRVDVLSAERATCVDATKELREAYDAALGASADLDRLEAEASDLERRVSTYQAQLERGGIVEVDLESLYSKRSKLSVALGAAEAAAEAARERGAALETQARLIRAVAGAKDRLAGAKERVSGCELSAEMVTEWDEYQGLLAARVSEEELCAALVTQEALAVERLSSAQALWTRANAQAAKRRAHELAGVNALNAAKLLDAASSTLSTRIRPALEGEVSRILGSLSSGRYDAVRIDADYNVFVRDDEQFLPLSEFSGGEVDLVALAMRLALAEVVGERQGVDALGLLILDECFGSQDRFRRESIRATLRNLREARGQIILISHVEGLEDVADMVVDINTGVDDDGVKSAEVVLT
jgi:exonuclease SbcC